MLKYLELVVKKCVLFINLLSKEALCFKTWAKHRKQDEFWFYGVLRIFAIAIFALKHVIKGRWGQRRVTAGSKRVEQYKKFSSRHSNIGEKLSCYIIDGVFAYVAYKVLLRCYCREHNWPFLTWFHILRLTRLKVNHQATFTPTVLKDSCRRSLRNMLWILSCWFPSLIIWMLFHRFPKAVFNTTLSPPKLHISELLCKNRDMN